MEWDGNDRLRMMWDWYYMCTDSSYIQFLQATRDATISTTPMTTPCQATHVPYDKVPNGGLVQGDANTTATTSNSSLPSSNWATAISYAEDITMLPAKQGCHADLQVALDKHCDDILCLLWTKSPANQSTIPLKLLTKIYAVNMGTMVKINDSFAHVGGKALTVMKLKELGSKAERKAQGLYDAGGDNNIQLNQAVLSSQTDAMIPDNQPPPKGRPSYEEFWQSLLPNGYHIISMDPDRNCLFCSLSDQLHHNNGQAHDFTCHQITNHICQHSDSEKFKEFLLLQDNHEDITDLDRYIHKMGQHGKWGGSPELYTAAWFYGVNITIYSQEYINTNGMLIINADGHRGPVDSVSGMRTLKVISGGKKIEYPTRF